MMKQLLLYICCSITICSYSQPQSVTVVEPDSVRSQYIQEFPDHFFVWPLIKERNLQFEISPVNGDQKALEYRPNNPLTVGLGAYVFDLALEFTFRIPITEVNREIFGISVANDYQLNALSKRFGGDLFYQEYEGFYLTDPNTPRVVGVPYPQRGDIVTRNYGVTGFYIFNKNFSLRSSYNFAERQIRNQGSFLLTANLSAFKLDADSAVLGKSYHANNGESATFSQLGYTTLSIAPGYSYNVIYKNYFLSGALMVGPAHNWVNFTPEGKTGRYLNRINTFAVVRLGLGYNGQRFFGGLSFIMQTRTVRFEDVYFTNASSTFRLLFGYRFREFGFLKRSVWEIPRAIF